MVIECYAILLLIFLMSYVYLRQGKPHFSLAILPLNLVPAIYLLGFPLSGLLSGATGFAKPLVHGFMVLVASVIACAFFGFHATRMRKKSNKTAYSILCTGFTVVFAWVLMLTLLNPFLQM